MHSQYEEKFYEECAKIIELINSRKSSLKSLLYKSFIKDKRKMLALLSGYFIMEKTMDKIVKKEKLYKKGLSTCLIKILAYEFFYGYRKNRLLLKNLKDRGLLERLKLLRPKVRVKHAKISNESQDHVLKYIRINTLKINEDVAIKALQKQGYKLSIGMDSKNVPAFEKDNKNHEKKFYKDSNIPNLYIFPPNTDFHDNELYISGSIIIQDKYSCIPALVLDPQPGSMVIDACAAPGNKTSHMACLMKNQGQIYAIELDANRFKLLKTQMWKFGASCVSPFQEDFTGLDPTDPKYKEVSLILVDPSCSGTGMMSRPKTGRIGEEALNPARLTRLRNFQFKLLDHAFKFPAVQRIVYSTCSLTREENEMVVEEIYAKHGKDFKLVPVMTKEFPKLRGVGPYKWCKKCLRSVPPPEVGCKSGDDGSNENATGNGSVWKLKENGIFVAMFVRKANVDIVTCES